MSEPWKDDPADDAVCADCGTPIDLDDCGGRLSGEMPMAEAPDGLPAPVFIMICHECEERHNAGR